MTVSPEAEIAADKILKLEPPDRTRVEIALIVQDAIDKWHLQNSDGRVLWQIQRRKEELA